MPTLSATPAVNAAIAAAQSLPGLIRNLATVDPALATQLTTKPLLASKTPWGVLAAALIGWASARYGFGLDATTTDLVAGVCVVLGSYAMRLTVKQPAAVVVPPATPEPPVPEAGSGVPVHMVDDDAKASPISRTLGTVLALALALGASACTTGQLATTRTALDDVRLFCAVGQSVVAVSTATGTPILAQGAPKAAVDTFCALAGGVAVSPPGAPVATVTIPAVTVPVGSK